MSESEQHVYDVTVVGAGAADTGVGASLRHQELAAATSWMVANIAALRESYMDVAS